MGYKRFWRNYKRAEKFAMEHNIRVDDIDSDNMGYFIRWKDEKDMGRGARRR